MNPTEVMYQKALEMGYEPQNIHIVSLGTGEFLPELEMDEMQACEKLYWPPKYQKAMGCD